MNLYDLTLSAIESFTMYRSPDLDEWMEKIDDVLLILEEPVIGNDKIENISLGKGYLEITTSYSLRCCPCSNTVRIPMEILTAENPLLIAKKYILSKKIEAAKLKVESLEKSLSFAKEDYKKICGEINNKEVV